MRIECPYLYNIFLLIADLLAFVLCQCYDNLSSLAEPKLSHIADYSISINILRLAAAIVRNS